MDGSLEAHVWTLVVRARQDDGYAVVWSEHVPGSTLEIRGEGRLVVDAEAVLAASTPRDYGVRLGQALFAGATLDAFRAARARGRERLHVVLEVEAPELRTLRWERLCGPLGEGWDFLRCDQRTPFTLRVASTSDRDYAPASDPRALVLVTSPTDLADYELEHFDTLAMLAGVRAALAPWPVDVLAFGVPDAAGPPTLEGLCDRLTAERYAAVHVVCHGVYAKKSGETVLYLADDDELTAPTPATKLLKRLGRLGGEVGLPSLWFLGACSTAAPEAEGALGGLGSRLCRELGAPAVIAMADRVSVDTAMELVRPLYRQLRAHGHVDLALAEACSAGVERADLVVPVLYARAAGEPLFPGTGPEGQVKAAPTVEEGRVFCEAALPAALGERFVGRAAVQAELGRRLAEGRPQALALVGAAGFGKTRAALEFVWAERARFPGGVFWIDAQVPARCEANHHGLLRQLQPGVKPLADLQQQGLRVADLLAAAARAHRPGQRQLWVLDHVPEPEPGASGAALSELCPRWGEVAVLITSRARPDDEGVRVLELESLAEADAGALLTAGLPAGSMTEQGAAAVVRWVGGMPLALELLARSLDLGDLSPTELVAMARTQGVARALDETQQVLRQVGAGAGLSGLLETMRLSYSKLSAEAQALALRLAQFGPEPLPTALVKALGPVSSRLARATLAGRNFVTGISGEVYGTMHRVLADFLRGLADAEALHDAVMALGSLLPPPGLWVTPGEWPRVAPLVVHAQALVLRCTRATGEIVELGNRAGVLLGRQGRVLEAESLQRHTLALAASSLPPEDRRCVHAAGNLGMTLLSRGFHAEAYALIADTTALARRVLGDDDAITLTMRCNLGISLLMQGDHAGAIDLLTELTAKLGASGTPSPPLLIASSNLALALWQVPDLPRARALLEEVLASWRRLGDADNVAALMAAALLASTLQLLGDLPGARAQIDATVATAYAVNGADDPATVELREKRVSILRDMGDVAGARAEQAAIVAASIRHYGPDNPATLMSQLFLAVIQRETGELADSKARLLAAWTVARRLGPHVPMYRRLLIELCGAYQIGGEFAGTRDLLAAELPEVLAALGETHMDYLELAQIFATVLVELDDVDRGRATLARVIAVLDRLPEQYNGIRLAAADTLGRIHVRVDNLASAREVQERVLADSIRLRAHPRDTLARVFALTRTMRWQGDLAGARALQARTLAEMRQRFGPRDPQTLVLQVELATSMADLGELSESEALAAPAVAALRDLVPRDHVALVLGQATLIRVRMFRGQLVEAQALLLELLPVLGPQHGGMQHEAGVAASELAGKLVEAGQGALAVPLLRAAIATLTQLHGPDEVNGLATRINLAVILFKTGGDRREALALLDEVGERIAPAGAEHPLAAALAQNRAKIAAA